MTLPSGKVSSQVEIHFNHHNHEVKVFVLSSILQNYSLVADH